MSKLSAEIKNLAKSAKISSFDIIRLIVPFLLEIAPLLGKATIETIQEYVRQAATQDGWTGAEKKAWVKKKLMEIHDVDLENDMAEWVFDFIIEVIVRQIKTEEPPVVVDPPPPTPPEPPPPTNPIRDVAWKVLTALEYDEVKAKYTFPGGTRILYNAKDDTYFIIIPGPGGAVPDGFEEVERVPFGNASKSRRRKKS